MICPHCGAQTPDNEILCPNCSSPLSTPRANAFYGYTPEVKKKKSKSVVFTVIVVVIFFFGLTSMGLHFFGGSNLLPSLRGDTSSQNVNLPSGAEQTDDPTVTITFREGLRLLQVADMLEEHGVCKAQDFVDATETMDISEYSFSSDIAANAGERYYRLEGYLFPDTYNFYRDENPQIVAETMLINYEERMTDDLRARAAEMEMSMDQAVALASIIIKEAGNVTEMPMVSSVFHNRLDDSYGKLESDPTYYYPYGSRDEVPEEIFDQFESRYNTYKIKGLPPGAICNPGLDAIEAALGPAESDYFFFVYDIHGKYYFAKTWAEHEENVALINQIKAEAGSQDEGQE